MCTYFQYFNINIIVYIPFAWTIVLRNCKSCTKASLLVRRCPRSLDRSIVLSRVPNSSDLIGSFVGVRAQQCAYGNQRRGAINVAVRRRWLRLIKMELPRAQTTLCGSCISRLPVVYETDRTGLASSSSRSSKLALSHRCYVRPIPLGLFSQVYLLDTCTCVRRLAVVVRTCSTSFRVRVWTVRVRRKFMKLSNCKCIVSRDMPREFFHHFFRLYLAFVR